MAMKIKNRKALKGAERVVLEEKHMRCMQLRRAGLNYAEIAKAVGFSNGSAAYKAVQKIIKDWAATTRESTSEVVYHELERLDRMWAGIAEASYAGDQKAILAGLRIMERRAKMLGLDQPEKVEHTLKTGDMSKMTNEQLEAISRGEMPALPAVSSVETH